MTSITLRGMLGLALLVSSSAPVFAQTTDSTKTPQPTWLFSRGVDHAQLMVLSTGQFIAFLTCKGNPASYRVSVAPKHKPEVEGHDAEEHIVVVGSFKMGSEVYATNWTLDSQRVYLRSSLDKHQFDLLVEQQGKIELVTPTAAGEFTSSILSVPADKLTAFIEGCDQNEQLIEPPTVITVDGIRVELGIEGITNKEIRDIITLSSEFGITEIESIHVGYPLSGKPDSLHGFVVLVKSKREYSHPRVYETHLQIRHVKWTHEFDQERFIWHGAWGARESDLRDLSRWVMLDGDNQVEITLRDGILYEDAVRVVNAIRRGELVDVRDDKDDIPVTSMRVTSVTISRDPDAFHTEPNATESGDSFYWVKIAGNPFMLCVRVSETAVSLYNAFDRGNDLLTIISISPEV